MFRTRPPTDTTLGFQLARRGVDEGLLSRLSTDAFHVLRSSSWGALVALFAGIYVGLNVLFAAVLWAGDASILNATPGFGSCFVFSVQTMATIGYGYLAPNDGLAHAVVAVESFVGIVYNAMVTGVFFSKFSTPRAKVLFSRSCVVTDDGGVPTLMFRCGNGRSTALVEATVRVSLTREERTPHGERFRRIHDLELRRSTSPFFAASWTVMHPIGPQSPLFGRSPEEVARDATVLLVTFTGIDDSLAASVHTRYTYRAEDLRWGHRFVDMMGEDPDGGRYVDYTKLHDTRPVPSPG